MKFKFNKKQENKNNIDYLLRYDENGQREVIEIIYDNFGSLNDGYAKVVRYKK